MACNCAILNKLMAIRLHLHIHMRLLKCYKFAQWSNRMYYSWFKGCVIWKLCPRPDRKTLYSIISSFNLFRFDFIGCHQVDKGYQRALGMCKIFKWTWTKKQLLWQISNSVGLCCWSVARFLKVLKKSRPWREIFCSDAFRVSLQIEQTHSDHLLCETTKSALRTPCHCSEVRIRLTKIECLQNLSESLNFNFPSCAVCRMSQPKLTN